MTTLFGIKNCDSVKKARTWLKDHDIEYTFHNYKKDGIHDATLQQAIAEHGWEAVINRRGTTWRELPQKTRDTMNTNKAMEIAHQNPSIVKRPLLLHNGTTYLGFKAEQYTDIFK